MSIITHYTKLRTLLNHILEEYSFQMNVLSRLNDPFEYIQRDSSAGASRDYDEQFSFAMKINHEVLHSKIKLGCFVADKGNSDNYETWDSIRNAPMWAHYGERNEGVAIVLDKDSFLDSCKTHLPYEWGLHDSLVEYSPISNSVEAPNEIRLDELSEVNEIEIAKYTFNKAKVFWFHKGYEWKNENEYRVMLFSNEIGPYKVDIKDSLKAVVFGDRVSYVVKDSIGQYCINQGIKALAVKYDDFANSYILESIT